MVGSAIIRALEEAGFRKIVAPTRDEVDLTRPAQLNAFFERARPAYVYMAAAKVGGILANDRYPADFIYQNLMIEANVVHAAFLHDVEKLLLLGSTCIYPRMAPQPMKEESLLTGPLEPTNEWYAIAKIAGVKLCQAYRKQHGCHFISAMPTNLYGPNDNFDFETAYVLPALIRKFHEAKVSVASEVVLWGSGKPLQEFLHVDDCAAACLFLMEHYDLAEPINIGVGEDLSILDLSAMIARVVGFEGTVTLDQAKPDGTPRKLVDVGRLRDLG